jgi:hypothetical protein
MSNKKTIKQLKDELDQLLAQVENAEPEEIESSSTKLKRATEIVSEIEQKLKFSEVEIRRVMPNWLFIVFSILMLPFAMVVAFSGAPYLPTRKKQILDAIKLASLKAWGLRGRSRQWRWRGAERFWPRREFIR